MTTETGQVAQITIVSQLAKIEIVLSSLEEELGRPKPQIAKDTAQIADGDGLVGATVHILSRVTAIQQRLTEILDQVREACGRIG